MEAHYPGYQERGAQYLDQEVVRDVDMASSRHPGDLPVFIRECLSVLK